MCLTIGTTLHGVAIQCWFDTFCLASSDYNGVSERILWFKKNNSQKNNC